MIAISGQVPSKVLGRGAFQDLDLSAVFRDVALSTVHRARGPCDHAELAATAVKHALDGRGVAHLVLPDEVQDLPSDAPAARPEGRRADLRIAPAPLDAALEQLRAARRPVVIVGQGARGATDAVRALAERLDAPRRPGRDRRAQAGPIGRGGQAAGGRRRRGRCGRGRRH